MKIQNIFLALFLTICLNSIAQNEKSVLFTIDNNSYYTDEFKRIYLKNSAPVSPRLAIASEVKKVTIM